MDWGHGLNSEQRKAVYRNEGPLLILAGAGSGKTTVLVARTGRLIDEGIVSADNLAVLTFTNKAARELKERVAHKLGAVSKKVWAGTFHSFGLQILKRFHKEAGLPKQFGILDPQDAGSILKEILIDFHLANKIAYDADKLLFMMSEWREKGITTYSKEDEYEMALEWALPKFLKRMESLGVVDFDSLILKPIELMDNFPEIKEKLENQYLYMMVDEFQDTNAMQMRFLKRLTSKHQNLAVVGDDDQSIYGWRGAQIHNILNFPNLYPNCITVNLEANYRSTPEIIELANAVIHRNKVRHPKKLLPIQGSSSKMPKVYVYQDETEEVEEVASEIQGLLREGVSPNETAVLYRSNGQGALLEAELRKRQVPYQISGGLGFFDRKETRDILAYLQVAFRPNELAIRRVLNTPTRGLGDKTVEKISAFMKSQGGSFALALQNWRLTGVESKAGEKIETFLNQIEMFKDSLNKKTSGHGAELLNFLQNIGYKEHLEKNASNSISATNRWRWVTLFTEIFEKHLERNALSVDKIKDFIDSMSLRESDSDEKKNAIHLLTLHACKGLEFTYVYLIGLEEDILPHKRLGNDVSEERRLFYVGITRAKKELFLTRAKKRNKNGKMMDCVPSRFLLEIPKHLYEIKVGTRELSPEDRKKMIANLFQKIDAKKLTDVQI